MDSQSMLKAIDAELEVLVRARSILNNNETNFLRTPAASKRKRGKYTLSAEARERIAAAQRKRWAARKKAAK
jgi:hypothetical protein